tara:strand:+ start:9428 stop:10288 length:861 start_codon:yes stop_codon:yes gene_type:complete
MTTSVYFNHHENTSEQALHQDLIIEAIKNYGIDVYYLPRKYVNEDVLYGEDTISEFNQAHLIEMYVKTVDGFEGEGDFISRFGLEIRDQVVFSVARRRFDNLDITEQDRPREGDVIFLPLNKKLYEIRFVEHESMFYQFGKLPIFDLTCELFQYDDQRIDTGVADIDKVEDELAYAINLSLGTGTGNYVNDENVYVGDTYASANTTARVVSWNQTDRELKITDIVGTFGATSNIVGQTSGAYYSLSTTPDTQVFVNDTTANNVTFETEADSIIDFSESNPFSEGNI